MDVKSLERKLAKPIAREIFLTCAEGKFLQQVYWKCTELKYNMVFTKGGAYSNLQNILDIKMVIDYAKDSEQEVVMIQADLAKWPHELGFVSQVTGAMGSGERMAQSGRALEEGAAYGGSVQLVEIQKPTTQRCSLLFVIVIHPTLPKLENMAKDGGALPPYHRESHVLQAFSRWPRSAR